MTGQNWPQPCQACGKPVRPYRRMRHVCRPADVEAHEWRAANPDPAVYYGQTGHCYGCGAPGTYCQCPDSAPCPCRDLHVMGSGLDADPAVVFADAPVPDGQDELFDGAL